MTDIEDIKMAGHTSYDGVESMKFNHGKGTIMKLIEGKRGEKELKFYVLVLGKNKKQDVLKNYKGRNETVKLLSSETIKLDIPEKLYEILQKDLTCDFHGIQSFGLHDYLEFSRLGSEIPSDRLCLADIKMGKHTWSPDATLEKRKQQEELWIPQKSLGYTWLGIKRAGEPKLDKQFGRTKSVETIKDCFDAYKKF